LGGLSLVSPYFGLGVLNLQMINTLYPGGYQGYVQDFFLSPNNALVITGGYDGLH
jgi:hypothetical protein